MPAARLIAAAALADPYDGRALAWGMSISGDAEEAVRTVRELALDRVELK